jgi:hypothetical protein
VGKLVAAVLVALATGGLAGSVLTYWSTDREMDVKMVEMAVGILSQDPTDNIAPARQWAVDVISHYSEKAVKPSPQVREALVNFKAVTPSWTTSIDYTVGSFLPKSTELPVKPTPPN